MPRRNVANGHEAFSSHRDSVSNVRKTAIAYGLPLRYENKIEVNGVTEIPAGHVAFIQDVAVEPTSTRIQRESGSVVMGIVKELVL